VFALLALGGDSHADDRRDRARQLIVEGNKAYSLREFPQAIAHFKEAYRIFPDASALKNLGQVYRLLDDHEQALFYFEQYLNAAPKDAPNRVEVEQLVKDLRELLATKRAVQDKPPEGVELPGEPPAAPPREAKAEVAETPVGTTQKAEADVPRVKAPLQDSLPIDASAGVRQSETARPELPARRPGRGLKTAGLVAGGVGVAAMAAGVYFGLQAQSLSTDVAEHYVPGDFSRGEAANRNMLVSYGIGGAALVTGGVLYYLGVQAANREAVSISVTGKSMGVGRSF
jgi:tetratricopeptide (TPR) repeat protein